MKSRVSEAFTFPLHDLTDVSLSDREGLLQQFSQAVRSWYRKNARTFPWRETDDPYKVLLSELMLQQTQTERVLPKYQEFLSLWPDLKSMSEASLTDILIHWKGLGYNRRAKALKDIALASANWGYTLPNDYDVLLTFPMIGPATASAILSFSYDLPSIYLETNIRRVILHYFFHEREQVRDREVREVLSQLIEEQSEYRHWYYALMDIGVVLRKSGINPNRRSLHYAKQSPFENSPRQVRSTVLDIITTSGRQTLKELDSTLSFSYERIETALQSLSDDGMIVSEGSGEDLFFSIKEE